MHAMAKKIKWTGPLAKPIKWSGPLTRALAPTIAGGEPSAELQAKREARFNSASLATCFESLKKLQLLKKQFDIPEGEGSWVALALALAMYSDIPGFRVEYPGQGRRHNPTKWSDGACIGLILDVEQVKADQEIKADLNALLYLVSNPSIYCSKPSRNQEMRKKQAKTLNARLTEARLRVREKHLEHLIKPDSFIVRLMFAPETECGKIIRQSTFGL
jgi:hypothetical protein